MNIKWSAILVHVREVSGSIFGTQTGLSDKYSAGILCPYRKIVGTCLKIFHDCFTPCISVFNIHNRHLVLQSTGEEWAMPSGSHPQRRELSNRTS
jgi:hypothetical protein